MDSPSIHSRRDERFISSPKPQKRSIKTNKEDDDLKTIVVALFVIAAIVAILVLTHGLGFIGIAGISHISVETIAIVSITLLGLYCIYKWKDEISKYIRAVILKVGEQLGLKRIQETTHRSSGPFIESSKEMRQDRLRLANVRYSYQHQVEMSQVRKRAIH